MSFEIEGNLHKKFDIESKSSSFQTREFVLVTEGTYPQYVKFQLTQDKCTIIDGYNEGEKLKVFFDLRGREWQEKYFTNLNAWKVEKANSGTSDEAYPPFSNQNEPPTFKQAEDPFGGNPIADDDDLPF